MILALLGSFFMKAQQADPGTYENFKQMFITPVYHFIIKAYYTNGKTEILTVEAFDIKMNYKFKRVMMLNDYGVWSPALTRVKYYKLLNKIRIN